MRKIGLFVFSFIAWFLLSWPCDITGGTVDYQMLAAGLVVSLVAALILGESVKREKHRHFILTRIFWGIIYIPVMFFYILLANLDVLYRVVHPLMPINPGILKVRTRLKTGAGRTALANSITLTPGTLTVDITDEGYLYIHCINVKTMDMESATEDIVRRFEIILEKIFE